MRKHLTLILCVVCMSGVVRAQIAPAPEAPPEKALLLKLQEITFDLQLENARLLQEIARLRKELLDVAKDRSAPDILKEWNAKPGETIDWERMQKRPAPEKKDDKPTSPTTPAETKKP